MLVSGLVIGVIGTLGMDLWALVVKYALRLPVSDWAMIGRWVAYLFRGRYRHSPISATPAVKHELALGWVVHYLTGISYGLLYLFILESILGVAPNLGSALLFGLATLAAPWLVMQPGLGLGLFAAKAPKPWLIRAINLSMHLAFALAMYLAWLLWL
ncbi:DUF2938 family protein [Halioxenophilus sp. WMMB6]|uniref:DUF2938 family protein n=1 Tax=Halioxenophilus sp. WMMB6 TaxID=3073815 RepID=UPI00295E90FD|nr:DUF2938 family protein [Halioxenophilus sp. WMMB6]